MDGHGLAGRLRAHQALVQPHTGIPVRWQVNRSYARPGRTPVQFGYTGRAHQAGALANEDPGVFYDQDGIAAEYRISFITMKTSKRRDIEQTYPLPDFIAKLRRLADALEAGKAFTIAVAGERLRIPADAHCIIEHEREGGQEELEFQLQWRRSKRPVRRARTASGG